MHRVFADTEPAWSSRKRGGKEMLRESLPPSNRECLCPIPILGIPASVCTQKCSFHTSRSIWLYEVVPCRQDRKSSSWSQKLYPSGEPSTNRIAYSSTLGNIPTLLSVEESYEWLILIKTKGNTWTPGRMSKELVKRGFWPPAAKLGSQG